MSGRPINIVEAMLDPELFGGAFRDLETWRSWQVILKAIFPIPMSVEELETFRKLTGRAEPDPAGYSESWLCIGRRGGKSRILALIACYLACFRSYEEYLAPGELAHIVILARDHQQAQAIFRYCAGFLAEAPMLHALIANSTANAIELTNRVMISVTTSDYRSMRSRTLAGALFDEIAYWPADELSANPAGEVANAVRPGMMTIPGAMLLAASSPFGRSGLLWEVYDEHFGKDSDVLVVQGATLDLNPSAPQKEIERALARDKAKAMSEYFAQFRGDVEGFVSLEVVRSCVGTYQQRGYDSRYTYFSGCDPSGGGRDDFTLSIGHREGDTIYIDAVFGKHAPSPQQVVAEYATILRSYRCFTVFGDKYAGSWPSTEFQKHKIDYQPASKNRTELYQNLLPLLNSSQIVLPNCEKVLEQIVGLQRSVGRNGRETIDHPRGKHDDWANACATAAERCSVANQTPIAMFGFYSSTATTRDYYSRPKTLHEGLIEDGALKGGFAVSR